MPRGLSFDSIGTVTHVAKNERHVTLKAVTTKPLDEVTVPGLRVSVRGDDGAELRYELGDGRAVDITPRTG